MHLFAGAGGGLLADRILGHEPIIAVEWNKYACRTLRQRAAEGWFPGLYVWEGDVSLFDPSEYAGRVDCIHAGFPCQDLSVAGNGAGLGEGTRSGLYREVLRIAGVVRPEFIFLENVSAILSRGLGVVLGDLASCGYNAKWLCLRASDVGAPHHRDRWFLLAKNMGNTHDNGQSPAEISKSPDAGNDGIQTGPQQTGEPTGSGQQHAILAYANSTGTHGRRSSSNQAGQHEFTNRCETMAYASSTGREKQHSTRKPTGTGYDTWSNNQERNQSWWSTEPAVGRVANGVASRVDRIKAIGNGQVPLQAAAAFSMLMSIFKTGGAK